MRYTQSNHYPEAVNLQGGVLHPAAVEQVEIDGQKIYQYLLLKFGEEPTQEQIDKYIAENVDVQQYSHKHPDWLKRLPKTVIRDRVGALVQGGVLKSELSADELEVILAQYTAWEADRKYKPEDGLLRHNGKLYQINQSHTSQEQYPPDGEGVTALYSEAVPESVIAAWEQPEGSHDAYANEALVTHDNPNDGGNIWIYESTYDGNTAEPGRDGTHDRYWTPIERA